MFEPVPLRMQPVLSAALEAVDPYRAVRRTLRREGDVLHVGEDRIALEGIGRVIVIGAGKAAAPMVRAVEDALEAFDPTGVAVTKYGHGEATRAVRILEAGHPTPDEAGLRAGEEILTLARSARAEDLVFCLLSGGGSALLEALPKSITLEALQQTTSLLLASGATIQEINTLRKHLSLVKGGHLARAVAPARLVTLVLSDVVGSRLDVIASGPTVADASTWGAAWALVERYGLGSRLPAAVISRLRAGLEGRLEDTPKAGDAIFALSTTVIVGDNAVAVEAARREAARLGYHPLIVTTYLEGEAREAARAVVAVAREVQEHARPVEPPACLIFGGETTVTLGEVYGVGGRNQEMALSAALALEGTAGITLVALATDGSDGPTNAAGGCVDGSTAARARALGLEPEAALRGHDACPLLEAAGALIRTGPTRTNVNDLIFVFVETTTTTAFASSRC